MVYTVRIVAFLMALYILLIPMKGWLPNRHRRRDYPGQWFVIVLLALCAPGVASWLFEAATG